MSAEDISEEWDEFKSKNAKEREYLHQKHRQEEAVYQREWIHAMIEEGKGFYCKDCKKWTLKVWVSVNDHGDLCDSCRRHRYVQLVNIPEKKRWIGAIIIDVTFWNEEGDVENVWVLLPDGEIKKFHPETDDSDDDQWCT